MNHVLDQYLEHIVEPTFEDFRRNPTSERHAFLACGAIYHAIDRVVYPKRSVGNLRKEWREKSPEFTIVDMVAHHFKHVMSDDERQPPRREGIPLSFLVFGGGALGAYATGTRALGENQMELRNLQFAIRDAIRFVRQQGDVTAAKR